MQPENQLHFDMLLQLLQLLAASYEQQIKAFPHFVNVPDEIALTFDDIYIFTGTLTSEHLISDEQKKSIAQINSYLDQLSEEEHYWTLSALQTSPQWENIRHIASDILVSMHVPKQAPNLFWIQYFTQKGDADKLTKEQPE